MTTARPRILTWLATLARPIKVAISSVVQHNVVAAGIAAVVIGGGVVAGSFATFLNHSAPTFETTNWWALGDSYISGEGTFHYWATDDNGWRFCHRSPESYAAQLGVSEQHFVACSGATAEAVDFGWEPQGAPGLVTSQLNHSGFTSARVVLLSAGGDSVGFETVLQDCLNIPGHSTTFSQCEGAVSDAIGKFSSAQYDLETLITNIHQDAPNAWIFLVGYPRLFPNTPTVSCTGLSVQRQTLLNKAEEYKTQDGQLRGLDGVLSAAAATGRKQGIPVQYIDTYAAFAGHELCSHVPDINLLTFSLPVGLGLPTSPTGHCHQIQPVIAGQGVCAESFHPNPGGYQALYQVVRAALLNDCVDRCRSAPSGATTSTATTSTSITSTSTSTTSNTTPPPTTPPVNGFAPGTPQPGHGSPQAAVVGFLQAALENDWGLACGYGLPDQQSLCTFGTAITGFSASGELKLGKTVVNGSQALVAFTGNLCITTNGSSQCGSNADPNAGLPGNGLSFSEAYSEALAAPGPSSPGFWDGACDEVGGQWYVDLGS